MGEKNFYKVNVDEDGYVLSIAFGGNVELDLSKYDLEGAKIHAYKLGNNKLILDRQKLTQINEEIQSKIDLQEIAELKHKLAETDYIWNVIHEGDHDEEYYQETIAQRHDWRMRIRELENK